ncbi:unnamed protein product [Effrenium voratum]|uniref:Uncharacterized protein n=1 Tax=Effrenium voratum TaxID=2562239 RepID=A0AA36IKB9_9DINO|nr:unnamed protein product [Effrenium voratum]
MAEKRAQAKEAALSAALQGAKAAETRIAEEAKKKFTRIDAFEGIYSFLALDLPCQVLFNNVMHYSARHALLAAQFPDAADQLQAPGNAEVAAAMKLVEPEAEAKDWRDIRIKAMERIQRDKFQRSEDFRKKLKDTGDRDLVWENDEDTFWGATKGRGQNHLGRVLMEVRGTIQDDTDFHSWLFQCCELESDPVRQPPVELTEGKDDGTGEKQVHKLGGKEYYRLGKLPSNAVPALHPSISREHALILHSKAEVARPTGGVAVMDLGSKFGTHLDGRRLSNAFVMEPLKSGVKLKLGASTRSYQVSVNLRSQIEELERQQRELMREVQTIDQDAADPVQAAKRMAKEEATCFVGNLEYDTEKAEILGLFQDCGHVEEVRFPGQEAGGKAVKGIAFVVFDSAMAARRACGLSGESFKGRRLKVAPATDRPKGGKGEKGEGKGKGKDKGERDHDRGDDSRQFLRDMLDGKWERGVALPSRSPDREPPRRREERREERRPRQREPSPEPSPPRDRSRSRSRDARKEPKGKENRKAKKKRKRRWEQEQLQRERFGQHCRGPWDANRGERRDAMAPKKRPAASPAGAAAKQTKEDPEPNFAAAASAKGPKAELEALPKPVTLPLKSTALVCIDFQKDFMEVGGFGHALGNDVTKLSEECLPGAATLLAAARSAKITVVHTKEAHREDLRDCCAMKLDGPRCPPEGKRIGEVLVEGMGRLLVDGSKGNEFMEEAKPIDGEIVVAKPGKGGFFMTGLHEILREKGISHLIFCGVTTEVCVNTTMREANDRGYECVLVADATGSYFPQFKAAVLEMVRSQGGIVGYTVEEAEDVAKALKAAT